MEAFLDECEPEEVDRNHPMTFRQHNEGCDGYVRRKSLAKDGGAHIIEMIINPIG
jgi:hypothetical protein